MSLRVRPAEATDAMAIRDIASSAWLDTYAGLLKPETIDAFVERAYSVERVERRIANHFFSVVVDRRRLIAFAEVVEEPDRLNLASIYASPDARGRGAGSLLLDAIRACFPDRSLAADVLQGNRKGETFYERRGFVPDEAIASDLFGEPVIERRWWLRAAGTS